MIAFQKARRRFFVVVAIIATVLAMFLSNPGGWRARIRARVFRVNNWPIAVPPPPDFQPQVPPGFKVFVFAKGFTDPRWLAVAPNGDVFVADSETGAVVVLHDPQGKGTAEGRDIFVDHLNRPFGVALHEDYVYIANTNEVLRFRFDPKTSKRLGAAEHILDLPGMGYNQHWTRSLAFTPDGKKLFVSVGSKTNVSIERDNRRAAILLADSDGKRMRTYARGLRNAVGIAVNPESGDLWATVNERDDIGDDIPSDYFTHVVDGGFYGWPFAYIGQHVDDRVASRPDMVAKTVVPDVLLDAHVAPLQFAFYDRRQFPSAYWQGAFIAEHGSWNRRVRTGYQVVFVPFRKGSPVGQPTPFFYGFVPDPTGKAVYGRMVGVAIAADGSLLISDDVGKVIWRVVYQPSPRPAR